MKKMLQNIIKPKYHIFSISFITIGLFSLNIFIGFVSCKKETTNNNYFTKAPEYYYASTYTPVIVNGVPHTFNGVISAKEKHLLSFKIGGELQFIAKENTPIKKGDLLARINSLELTNNLTKINSSLNDINEDLEKLYELQKDSIGPVNTIKKLEVQKKIQESNYSSALYNINKSTILAPFDGFINKRFRKAGEFTQPTAPVIQYYSHKKNATFFVPEETVTTLSLDQQVKVAFQSNTTETYPAIIESIALSPSSNGLYKVTVALKDNQQIKDGFIVTLTVNLNTFEENSILPLRYVDKVISNDSLVAYVLKKQKATKLIIPYKKNYDNGFIIESIYAQYNFIETFRDLEEGIIIRNK